MAGLRSAPLKIIIKSKIPKKRRRLREALSRGHGSSVPNEHGVLSEVEVTSLALAYQRWDTLLNAFSRSIRDRCIGVQKVRFTIVGQSD